MAVDRIWVVVEPAGGGAATNGLELLAGARGLAATVEAVTFGDANGAAATLGDHGAAAVLTVDTGNAMAGVPVAAAIVAALEARGSDRPTAILLPQTYEGRDIAGRLSVALDAPVLANAVGLSVDGVRLVAEHAVFGGSTIVQAAFTTDRVQLFLVRPKTFVAEGGAGAAGTVEPLPIPDTGRPGATTVLARHTEERQGPKLDEAAVVVSGGRGLGDKDRYALVEELARLLHGAPGATRAIVDAGWVPYSYQVGQTGKTVKPDVYIAVGISGATQHMVGMKGAKKIIAINKDRDAPIFAICDLGIVGDATKILPKLIDALKNR
ncbi:MAG TPA: electron transfer flavoprotein subunit alpha/FixB family protein [Acidimicrobiales bacterium]|nr:electron transfer flavoprotein subunit alpha/FixB family protein [Acidimicrobiales bacterium]